MKRVLQLLKEGAVRLLDTSSSATLDAQLLLSYASGLSKVNLVSESQQLITKEVEERFFALITRRERGEPIAYIIGTKEFWGLEFDVTPAVLVPRPETEVLVERAVALLMEMDGESKLLDLGTGSGCIAIAIAHELKCCGKSCQIVAVDNSSAALVVAKRNAKKHGVEHLITFIESDWFSCLDPRQSKFDIIVSNPPYIAQGDQDVSPELKFEPAQALYAGDDGLDAVRELVSTAPKYFKAGGRFLCEIGAGQRGALEVIVRRQFKVAGFHHDLAGKCRVVEVQI